MCVRDETRNAQHLGNELEPNISCRAGEDVLADVLEAGTSQPVVSSSTIYSCASNTKLCGAAGTNTWQRKGTSAAKTLSHATMHMS